MGSDGQSDLGDKQRENSVLDVLLELGDVNKAEYQDQANIPKYRTGIISITGIVVRQTATNNRNCNKS